LKQKNLKAYILLVKLPMLLDGLAVIIFNGAGLAVGLVDKPFNLVFTITNEDILI
jgi:hypothetical protein